MKRTLKRNEELKLAQEIAHKAHNGQTRRDGSPYIEHPKRISESLKQSGMSLLTQIVAWLHDVIEDSPAWNAEKLIEAGISPEAVEAITLLTKQKDVGYVSYVGEIKSNSVAKTVKIADMVDNLTDDPTPKQKQKYLKGLLFLSL